MSTTSASACSGYVSDTKQLGKNNQCQETKKEEKEASTIQWKEDDTAGKFSKEQEALWMKKIKIFGNEH